jgi:hypothetical protein
MPALIPLLWANKRLIGEVIGIIALAAIAWWFFWHNPKVIKQLENEKAELSHQVEAAHAAINLLTDIERSHDATSKNSFTLISTIRSAPKPKRDGLFYDSRVLQAVPTNRAAK